MLDLFNSLFGEYEPIVSQAGETVTNWGTIANYVFVGIVLYTVCKSIGIMITSCTRGVNI